MTRARKTQFTAAGLALCAIAIILQKVTGASGYPTIPPGAVITAVAAILVALVPWRFIPVLGFLLGAFILFGAFVTAGTGDRLSQPGTAGPFLGTLLQMIGLIMAVIFGALATVDALRPGRAA